MYRYLTLPLLLINGIIAQAQPTDRLYAVNEPKTQPTVEAAPRKPKVAESPFYVKVYGFYGLLTPGSQIRSSTVPGPSKDSPISFKTARVGLGAGPRAGIGVGLIINDFINVGLDAELLFINTLKTELYSNVNNYVYTGSSTYTLQVASLIPNITFKALSRPSYYIYNRLGIVGGMVIDYKINQNYVYTPNGGKTIYDYSSDYTKNSLAIGYQAALGIQFRLSQHLRGYVEVAGYNQSFKPQELVYTATTITPGIAPQPPTITTTQYTTQYKDQGNTTNTGPTQSPSINVPMNSVGVGAGLSFRF